jgi:hypothetical protein
MQGEIFLKNTYPKMLGRYSWVNEKGPNYRSPVYQGRIVLSFTKNCPAESLPKGICRPGRAQACLAPHVIENFRQLRYKTFIC